VPHLYIGLPKTVMNDTIETQSQRREARYRAYDGHQVVVVAERTAPGQPAAVQGKLIDLSRSGAKVSISSPIPVDESFTLRIQVSELELDLTVNAEVCWMRPAGPDSWYLGCVFAGELPDHVLPKLALAGYVDQRQDTRYEISLDACARQELAGDNVMTVRLVNYSAGGFRLFSSQPANTGGRLLLELHDTSGGLVRIPAKAVWQLDAKDGHYVGCTFLNNDGFDVLAQLVKSTKAPQSVKPQRRPFRLLRWACAAALAAAVSFAIFAFLR
jgi:hypothetical protein